MVRFHSPLTLSVVEGMKNNKYQKRFYRHWVNTADLMRSHIVIEETDLEILTDRPLKKYWLKKRILGLRQDIKNYIAKDRRFLTSLKPIAVELDAPIIIKQMAQAAYLANVGPMAAVAGCIAQLLAQGLTKLGYGQVIIENGGDIFLSKQKKNRLVAIFAGDSKFSGKLNLLIRRDLTPCGICTSSGTVGHSLSFGNADSVVIKAKDSALADAVATATCNLVKSHEDFNQAIKFARKIRGVSGVLIILGDYLASWGDIEINFS